MAECETPHALAACRKLNPCLRRAVRICLGVIAGSFDSLIFPL
jgi:hypothetical protein